ncbi:hypothetical protein ACJ3XI_03760 [Litorimonas sp. RW-G-Af-16]|uniref:hypothetical protein n=1 Tax=Litorimonas sp. RW-G-Af-16 TaxID=3241168 RepID=UPI00390CB760
MTLFRNTALLSLAVMAAALSGCASTPDPAKVCTAEWIAPRADRAVDRIETRAKRSLKTLKKAGDSWSTGKTPGPFTMLALSSSMKSLEKELKNGRGMRDLKTLAATCDDPKLVSDAMGRFLREQGLPDQMIEFVEGLQIYQNLLAAPIESQVSSNNAPIEPTRHSMMHH